MYDLLQRNWRNGTKKVCLTWREWELCWCFRRVQRLRLSFPQRKWEWTSPQKPPYEIALPTFEEPLTVQKKQTCNFYRISEWHRVFDNKIDEEKKLKLMLLAVSMANHNWLKKSFPSKPDFIKKMFWAELEYRIFYEN